LRLDEYSNPIIPKKFSKITTDRFRGDASEWMMTVKLRELGWTRLGKGSFATVYENYKKPFILKVTDLQDSSYAYYVSMIRKFHNKHFPKISDLKFIEVEGKKYYIYLIEKLKSLKKDMKPIIYFLGAVAHAYNATMKDIINDFNSANYKPVRKEVLYYLRKNPELVKAARIVGKYKDKSTINGIFLDMHSLNMMQREDGTIVISDPYASFE